MEHLGKVRALTLCAALVSALMIGATPASAAPGGVEFSTDGVAWSASLPGPVFSPAPVLVPGGSDSATIRMRNNSAFPTLVRIDVTHIVASGTEFGGVLSLTATASGAAASPSVGLGAAVGCSLLLEGVPLAAGAVASVTFTIAMADAGGTLAQGQHASADLLVSLRESAAPPLPITTCPADASTIPLLQAGSTLASTGAAPQNGALALGMALVGIGGWFLLRAFRRRWPAREL